MRVRRWISSGLGASQQTGFTENDFLDFRVETHAYDGEIALRRQRRAG